ncbi:MAG: PepSY domain-containing protein, partial [Telmatospirillum sp.]|nr:PepSY domain-containing protein [Telmatospirillum sp.]
PNPTPTGANAGLKSLLAGHGLLGLWFAALLHLVCLTGTLSVLVDELSLWEQPEPGPADILSGPAAGGDPAALGPVVDKVLAAVLADATRSGATGAGRATSLYLMLPTTGRQRLTIHGYGAGGEDSWLALSDGAVIPLRTPWTEFVTDLHMTLTLPSPFGATLVGLSGVILLALLGSGAVAHRRIFRDAFELRIGGARRLAWADLHNRIGLWGLPFHITIAGTGAFFGLATIILMTVAAAGFRGDTTRAVQPLIGPEIAGPATAPAALPPMTGVLAAARAARPDGRIRMISVENILAPGQRIGVEMALPRHLARGDRLVFDADGHLAGIGAFASGGGGQEFYSATAELHFGFFGGLPIRLAYVAMGGLLTVLVTSGVSIWLARRRPDSPLPARLWRGWCTGVPVGLAAAFAASPWLPVAPVFWVSAALILGLGLVRPRLLTPMLIATLIAAAGPHLIHLVLAGTGGVPLATGVVLDTTLLGLALGLGVGRARHRKLA